jgi:hypothetical protein
MLDVLPVSHSPSSSTIFPSAGADPGARLCEPQHNQQSKTLPYFARPFGLRETCPALPPVP